MSNNHYLLNKTETENSKIVGVSILTLYYIEAFCCLHFIVVVFICSSLFFRYKQRIQTTQTSKMSHN